MAQNPNLAALSAAGVSVKTLVFKVIPDATTRMAAMKRGEIDIAYGIQGELVAEANTVIGGG